MYEYMYVKRGGKMKRKCIGDYIQKGLLIVVLALIPILGTGIVVANDETDNIDIRIAPATLNLNDDVWASDDPYVTVHAEIPYRTVDTDSLTLETDGNTVDAIRTEADNRGYLVVKFDRRAVVGIVEVGKEVMTLTGTTTGDEPFTGSATIRVIDQPVE
jgi:hypothetical protein